eukprot:TRINITY_DN73176_c0_g1_i1.p1 TRINITY_DN73176_c0_g1~~TRINITY_DN73176_c0_g1_i1.p1  ORF type:complete len:604 (-),score=77.83 TRINITY_DN73176_c0_g1_i1:161-1972(-)
MAKRPPGIEGWSAAQIQQAIKESEEAALALTDAERHQKLRGLFSTIIKQQGLCGHIETFGSHRSGFRTGSSDLDVVYLPTDEEETAEGEFELTPTMILQRFAVALQRHGFKSITTVYQAAMPILKCLSPDCTDIDLCVGNRLGVQNSRLMAAYANLDPRVQQVGKHVKQWAKACDIAISSDGHLNSYAYTLMTIFYLMYTEPPVVCNLQLLSCAVDMEPVRVRDNRWGSDVYWDCQFLEETALVPASVNNQSVEDLVAGFFHFYANIFDWQNHSVSVRLGRTLETRHAYPVKAQSMALQGSNVWVIEDPFNLKHNLASNTTATGRQRILDRAQAVLQEMRKQLCPPLDVLGMLSLPTAFWLKCRVHHDKTSKKDFCELFKGYPIQGLHWPLQQWNCFAAGRTEAFLQFASEEDRRFAHQLNETYVGTWQVRLLTCSSHALQDAIAEGSIMFEEVDRALLEGPPPQEDMRHIDHAEQIRIGLRLAESREEVLVLVQRAKALDLQNEVLIGERLLQVLSGNSHGSKTLKGAGDEDAWMGRGKGSRPRVASEGSASGYKAATSNATSSGASASKVVEANGHGTANKHTEGRQRAATTGSKNSMYFQ